MHRILRSKNLPTAVFSSSDVFAYSSIKCAKDNGFHVPEDISFFGMDDVYLSRHMQPALSTLRIDTSEMSKSAMTLIDKMISGKPSRALFCLQQRSLKEIR